jgi:hypothetical protein
MGIQIELAELLVIQLVMTSFFARFEVETRASYKILKWIIIAKITLGLYYYIGHWSALFPVLVLIPGTIYHFRWCKKNGIDPLKATPRKKYYELRKWKWEE